MCLTLEIVSRVNGTGSENFKLFDISTSYRNSNHEIKQLIFNEISFNFFYRSTYGSISTWSFVGENKTDISSVIFISSLILFFLEEQKERNIFISRSNQRYGKVVYTMFPASDKERKIKLERSVSSSSRSSRFVVRFVERLVYRYNGRALTNSSESFLNPPTIPAGRLPRSRVQLPYREAQV